MHEVFLNRYQHKKEVHSEMNTNYTPFELSNVLSKNVDNLHKLFYQTPDLTIREFQYKQIESECALVYLEGLTDKNMINNHILHPLMYETSENSTSTPRVTIGGVELLNVRNKSKMQYYKDAVFYLLMDVHKSKHSIHRDGPNVQLKILSLTPKKLTMEI